MYIVIRSHKLTEQNAMVKATHRALYI